MKLVSWNVNGLRACLGKGFLDYCAQENADVDLPAGDEAPAGAGRLRAGRLSPLFLFRRKKGLFRHGDSDEAGPLSVRYGLGLDEHDHEGRLITAEYPEFYLVCCYTPNSQDGLKRLPYRMEWEDALRAYLLRLDAEKPVVYCGDLNVAHEEIDIKNPKANRQNAGFSDEERAKMTELLSSGFADTFRRLHPNLAGVYSWWSYRFHARENNAGWRIDYFIVSERLLPRVLSSEIRTDVFGSDHCPVVLELTV
ncbi:MAG: exodeoxyribonuclease III [Acutalibacteraceae bacterium]